MKEWIEGMENSMKCEEWVYECMREMWKYEWMDDKAVVTGSLNCWSLPYLC
jgi:hypothetical protein